MENRDNVITFDNLRQADSEIAGQTKAVKTIMPTAEHFTHPNCKGSLYRPESLGSISERARITGARFREMFQQ
jgi:hypothetical protein